MFVGRRHGRVDQVWVEDRSPARPEEHVGANKRGQVCSGVASDVIEDSPLNLPKVFGPGRMKVWGLDRAGVRLGRRCPVREFVPRIPSVRVDMLILRSHRTS